MKKGTKGMLIAAGAFAVAGIGLCIGGISVAAVETGGNVFDQAGQLLQDNDYPLSQAQPLQPCRQASKALL